MDPLPMKKFGGAKPGLYFGTVDGVTGYHVDHRYKSKSSGKDFKKESDPVDRKEHKKEKSSKKDKKKRDKKDKKEKKEKKHKKEKEHKRKDKKKKKKSSDRDSRKRDRSESESSSSSNSSSGDSSNDSDDNAPRSIITGKKIKLDRELTYEDRLQEIERQAKRHAMNTQY